MQELLFIFFSYIHACSIPLFYEKGRTKSVATGLEPQDTLDGMSEHCIAGTLPNPVFLIWQFNRVVSRGGLTIC